MTAAPHTPAGIRRSTPYVPELEALRGLAITLVVAHHVDALVGRLPPALLADPLAPLLGFIHGGHSGVSLFFVLSAFLLSQPFLIEASGGRAVSRWDYFKRRALRIIPLYWLAVAIAHIASIRHPWQLWDSLPYFAFVERNAGFDSPLSPFNAAWWSLTTEVEFYALLPFLPMVLGSRRGRIIGWCLAGAYAVIYLALCRGLLRATSLQTQVQVFHSVIGRAPAFAFGIAAAWVCRHYGDRVRDWCRQGRFASPLSDALMVVVLLALGILLNVVSAIGYGLAESRWHPWHIIEAALWAALLLLMLLTTGRLRVLFSNRVFAALGIVSYSIYLVHFPLFCIAIGRLRATALIPQTGWSWTTAGAIIVLAALCLLLSTLTYAGVERPFLRRKARIEG